MHAARGATKQGPRGAGRALGLALLLGGLGASARAEPGQAGDPAEGASSADASAGGPVTRAFGRLERESIEDALAELGVSLDPNPEGKVVRLIHVVNQEVFSRRDWHFQLLNVFHRTTRRDVIARELLLQPGQRYSQVLANESLRNLQSPPPLFFADGGRFAGPQLSSVLAVLPVASPEPGTVDVLAVTRDLWSLRFNTELQFQRDRLSLLRTSLSENNLFGWRKYLAAGFELDQGRFGVGPSYFDPNLAGTRLTLLATGRAWYARDGNRYEGDSELFSLRYPLYALASRWGGGLDVSQRDHVVRRFCHNELCPVAVGATTVPFIYRRQEAAADAHVVRSFGRAVIQRLTGGYRFERPRSLVLADFPSDPAQPTLADDFLARWAPGSETRSELYLRYELFTPRFHLYRDLDTFDLREDRRLGPHLTLEIGAGAPALGADHVAYPMSATASWVAAPWGAGHVIGQVQVAARLRPGELIDQRLSGVVYAASPMLARAVRVVVSAMTDVVRADSYRTRFYLGGDTGLRGYQIGEFHGTVQAAAHAELRSAPLAVHSQSFGAVLFYDVGHAAESYGALVPRHDVGVGLRWLIPQLNSSVFRLDWAIPTQDGPYTHAGLPGRITAGFMQSFWLLDSPKGFVPLF